MTPPESEAHDRRLLSRRTLEIVTALAAMAFGAIVIKGAFEFPVGWTERGPDPGYFPFWIGCIVVLGGAGALVEAFSRPGDRRASALTVGQLRRVLAFLAPILGFLLVTSFLGIYVGMLLYLAVVMVVQGGYRLPAALSLSIGVAVFFYVVFEKLLKVPLMKGPLEAWLGIH
jgi:hypothetical protein